MRWVSRLLVFSLLTLALVGCSKPDAYDSDGKPIRMSHYRGKWVLINYWATWCNPCKTEMPILNRLFQRYSDRVVVLGVSFDHLTNYQLNDVRKAYRLTYPLLSFFPIKKYGVENIGVLPITFIINPQGHLVKTLKGPQSTAKLKRILK